MMVSPTSLAPVLLQPALPVPATPDQLSLHAWPHLNITVTKLKTVGPSVPEEQRHIIHTTAVVITHVLPSMEKVAGGLNGGKHMYIL